MKNRKYFFSLRPETGIFAGATPPPTDFSARTDRSDPFDPTMIFIAYGVPKWRKTPLKAEFFQNIYLAGSMGKFVENPRNHP